MEQALWALFYLERDTIYIRISEFVCREIDGIWHGIVPLSSQAKKTTWSAYHRVYTKILEEEHGNSKLLGLCHQGIDYMRIGISWFRCRPRLLEESGEICMNLEESVRGKHCSGWKKKRIKSSLRARGRGRNVIIGYFMDDVSRRRLWAILEWRHGDVLDFTNKENWGPSYY